MKRSIYLIIGVVVLIAVGIFLYDSIQNNRPSNIIGLAIPTELLELTHENRIATFPEPHPNLSDILESFKTPNLDAEIDAQIAERIRQYQQRSGARPSELTEEQIVYELDFLFELLRYGYGAYQYFGGDDVFIPLHRSILTQLRQTHGPITVERYLNSLLLPALRSVISDNHFWVDRHSVGISSQLTMNQDFVVHRTDDDFITNIDGINYRVVETTMDGQQIEGLLPTLAEDGQLVWAFGYVFYGLQPSSNSDMDVIFEDTETGTQSTHVVPLSIIRNHRDFSNTMYSLSRRNGIPVLRNRHLSGNLPHSFTNTGAALRNEPIVILDLRGHSGGNDGIAAEWIHAYTGHMPNYEMIFSPIFLSSLTTSRLNSGIPSSTPPEWHTWQFDMPRKFIQNENFIIVLTDNNIGSAGDSFVGFLRQLENVLIVGTNTGGVLVTGNLGTAVLPYSRAAVHFGVSLNVRPNLSQFEGVGFAPDLWVPPNESLDRVLRFIERYGIVHNE